MELAVYWSLCAMLGLSVGLTISLIGKPRTPITPNVALATVVFAVLQFIALSYLYQR